MHRVIQSMNGITFQLFACGPTQIFISQAQEAKWELVSMPTE